MLEKIDLSSEDEEEELFHDVEPPSKTRSKSWSYANEVPVANYDDRGTHRHPLADPAPSMTTFTSNSVSKVFNFLMLLFFLCLLLYAYV